MSRAVAWVVVLVFLPILLPFLLWFALCYDWQDTVPQEDTEDGQN